MNFLFRGSDGHRYIGTAGHCVIAGSAEVAWEGRSGPDANDGEGNPIGDVAYAALVDGRDFALIRLHRDIDTDPTMCIFGGPRGINRSREGSSVVLHYYGNGTVVGRAPIAEVPLVPGRSAIAPNLENPRRAEAVGLATPGDSGAGVTDADGLAVGVISQFGPRFIQITRLSWQLPYAEAKLGVGLRLVTGDGA